jgi:hypothetical protein
MSGFMKYPALILLLILSSNYLLSQSNSVSGVVQDPEGETLIGVNILEQDTQNGTITDNDGVQSG